MTSKITTATIAVLLALLLVPTAFAQTGTPNLGNTAIAEKTVVFLDSRIFDTSGDQDTLDNTVWTLGFMSPIDEDLEFRLVYSQFDVTGPDPINGDLLRTYRKVLSPTIKWAACNKLALTFGADIGIKKAFAQNLGGMYIGAAATYDVPTAVYSDFTPGIKAQYDFITLGSAAIQLAGQVAWWDEEISTNTGEDIEGFGTVFSLGGGVVWPLGSRLCLIGDAMFPVSGDNVVDDETGEVDTELVWSAGGEYIICPKNDVRLRAYATNAMQPTIAGSIISSPSNGIGLGIGLSASF